MESRNNMIDHEYALSIVNRLELFDKFTLRQKREIAHFYKNILIFEPNQRIISEGEIEPSFYILLAGKVHVTKGDENKLLTELLPGEFFGEVSFLTKSPRNANVIAKEQSIVIKVSDRILKSLDIEIREMIKDKIIEKLIARLDHMNSLFVENAMSGYITSLFRH